MREAHGAGSHVWRISRLAPAFAVRRGSRPERCRSIVGPLCHLRLLTGAPGPSFRKRPPKGAAFFSAVYFFRIVALLAYFWAVGGVFDRAIFDPGKGVCRG